MMSEVFDPPFKIRRKVPLISLLKFGRFPIVAGDAMPAQERAAPAVGDYYVAVFRNPHGIIGRHLFSHAYVATRGNRHLVVHPGIGFARMVHQIGSEKRRSRRVRDVVPVVDLAGRILIRLAIKDLPSRIYRPAPADQRFAFLDGRRHENATPLQRRFLRRQFRAFPRFFRIRFHVIQSYPESPADTNLRGMP